MGTLPHTPVNVVRVTPDWGTNGGHDIRTAENALTQSLQGYSAVRNGLSLRPCRRASQLAELASAKRVETILIDDIEQLWRRTAPLLSTLLSFIHGELAGVQVLSK